MRKAPKPANQNTGRIGRPLISRVTADDFHAQVSASDFVVIEFSKREVEEGLIGTAVERLMLLSDTPEFADRFMDGITFTFSGYDNDPRPVHQIPECVAYLRNITNAWPFWYHFLEKKGDSIAILMLCLCDSKVVFQNGSQIGTSIDMAQLSKEMMRMFDGMNAVHTMHHFPEHLNRRMTDVIVERVKAMSGRADR
ncbi:hypothetical protein [Hydrogenophaga sp. 2FB]|uniref:hypothetical protein n=1 Tax=Hydrogenophaga sp. 2FB TaxID=2502187 RepID=UPI0010FA2815|nr:hypothetical protein [Hydrogenophaga sp. 2FB]